MAFRVRLFVARIRMPDMGWPYVLDKLEEWRDRDFV